MCVAQSKSNWTKVTCVFVLVQCRLILSIFKANFDRRENGPTTWPASFRLKTIIHPPYVRPPAIVAADESAIHWFGRQVRLILPPRMCDSCRRCQHSTSSSTQARARNKSVCSCRAGAEWTSFKPGCTKSFRAYASRLIISRKRAKTSANRSQDVPALASWKWLTNGKINLSPAFTLVDGRSRRKTTLASFVAR